MPLSREAFVHRWKINVSSESQASQSHFIDLCEMLGVPAPAADRDSAETYTFEKPVSKVYGGKGAADVWKRGYFAWEYKSRDRDLKAAYKQLNDYREDLGNPPLLVVCDMDRFEIHTNFVNTTKRVYSFTLDDLKKNVVTPPARFHPSTSSVPSSPITTSSVPIAPTPTSPRRLPRPSPVSPSASKSKSAPSPTPPSTPAKRSPTSS